MCTRQPRQASCHHRIGGHCPRTPPAPPSSQRAGQSVDTIALALLQTRPRGPAANLALHLCRDARCLNKIARARTLLDTRHATYLSILVLSVHTTPRIVPVPVLLPPTSAPPGSGRGGPHGAFTGAGPLRCSLAPMAPSWPQSGSYTGTRALRTFQLLSTRACCRAGPQA